MKIQLLSDVHFEFHADGGQAFIDSLDPTGVDVLVLAGDIAVGANKRIGLEPILNLARRYPHTVYVAGNHEYYGGSHQNFYFRVQHLCERAQKEGINLHYLENSLVVINGVRFLGSTMWFQRHNNSWAQEHRMNDFFTIEKCAKWVYDLNKDSELWLDNNIQKGDIVVTHHLPSFACVDQKYVGSLLNIFFANHFDHLIYGNEPKLWMFGHTHESVDKMMNSTRLLCNPYGYSPKDLNPNFIKNLVIDV